MPVHTTVGILLAAGSGRRFDPDGLNNKLLQLLDNGVPVALQSARRLLDVLGNVVAVVQCPVLAAMLSDSGCHALMFADANRGMGASLACGVEYVAAQYPTARAVLVGLADMPFISAVTTGAVVDAIERGADIVQPVFKGAGGHPVGFSSRHFASLMALHGDTGARHLMQQFSVVQIPVDDPGIIQDVDYPSDLSSPEI